MTDKNEEYDLKLLRKNIPYKRLGTYTTQLVKIDHMCLMCGTIEPKTPKKVLAGRGCRRCSVASKTRTAEDYDAKIKDSMFFRVDDYINSLTEIQHTCKSCGSTHLVRPASVLRGHKCKFCANRVRHTTEQYTDSIAGRNIEVLSEYLGRKTKVLHKCTICNSTWYAAPSNVVSRNSGCPTCARSQTTSKFEEAIASFISSKYSGWIIRNDRSILEGQELDVVLPDLGIAIECNGVYWHREEAIGKRYHLDKTIKVQNFGYRLIHINEDEYVNKPDIVFSRLSSLLGLNTIIYARNCKVAEIDWPKEFLDDNHIQGAGSPSTINLALTIGGEVAAVMTFGSPRFTDQYDYELIRFCSLTHVNVVGGASKLLKYFLNRYKGSIVSYSDKRWSEGELYRNLNFKYYGSSEPNYRYYKGTASLSRYQCQKHKLVAQGFDTSKTEAEIMKERGYHRVYDCGNDIWVLNNL